MRGAQKPREPPRSDGSRNNQSHLDPPTGGRDDSLVGSGVIVGKPDIKTPGLEEQFFMNTYS